MRIGILLSLLLCGCAISPRPLTGPNGRPGYAMRCSGAGRTLEACYQKAGQLCPSGYDVISEGGGGALLGTPHGLIGASRHSLMVECK